MLAGSRSRLVGVVLAFGLGVAVVLGFGVGVVLGFGSGGKSPLPCARAVPRESAASARRIGN